MGGKRGGRVLIVGDSSRVGRAGARKLASEAAGFPFRVQQRTKGASHISIATRESLDTVRDALGSGRTDGRGVQGRGRGQTGGRVNLGLEPCYS